MNNIAAHFNETAIKDFGLRCSKIYRAGKFTRTGQDFLDELYIDIENVLRELRNKGINTIHPALGQGQAASPTDPTPDDVHLIKGAFLEVLETVFNQMICRMIQTKVQKQPTVGCTLSRTR